jgi:predicted ABC-type ATPase
METGAFVKKPLLIVIAGPNGSGKTTVTSKILKHNWLEDCEYINPDNIARDNFGDWNSPDAVLKAALLSEKMREDCLQNNKSLIFETVLSAYSKIEFIEKAKLKGYFVRLFFIGTVSPILNASRIAQRVIDGGHDVPITKIISRYSKSIVNCSLACRIVDRAYIYDNSVEYEEPKLLFRISDGKIAKEYKDLNAWALQIFNSVV